MTLQCSCGRRLVNKCTKESSSGFGKMCLKDDIEPDECDEHYNYEEQEYEECKVMWEYGLDELENLSVREKM